MSGAILKAITIWQPWATLIMVGAKPYEFRRWPAPASLVGERIVNHAGARKMVKAELQELLLRLQKGDGYGTGLIPDKAIPVIERALSSPGSLPLASALGTMRLGRPQRASELFPEPTNDSDRIDHAMWAWPFGEIESFEPFVPCKGAQGFWNYTPGGAA